MPRKFANLFLTAALCVSLAGCDSAEERAEKFYQSAVALIQTGDNARAVVELRNVFKLNPSHREARRTLAEIQAGQRDFGGAFQSYLLLVEQYPDDAKALVRLATLAILTGQWPEAELYGKRAADLLPADPDVKLVTLFIAYRKAVSDQDEARRRALGGEAEALLPTLPDSLLLARLLTDWYITDGRERDALAQVDRSITLSPDDLSLYQVRLQILNALGETPKFEAELRRLVDRFPDEARIPGTLVAWYVSQGRPADAEKFLSDLAQTGTPGQRDSARTSLIQFVRQTRGDDAALTEIRTFVDAGQDAQLFRSLAASIRFDRGERDAAIAELEDILKTAEPSERTNNLKVVLARMRVQTGNAVAARALVEEVLATDPGHVEATKLKAAMLIDADKADEAIALLRQASDSAPRDASILTLLAQAHERNGNRDLMGEMLARAAEVSNRAPAESLRLAAFLIARDQNTAAEQALVEALRQTPGNVALLTRLGELYLRMQNLPQAQQVEATLRALAGDEPKAVADAMRIGILQAQKRGDDAIALIESLGRDTSDKAKAAVAVMRAHLANGDVEGARQSIDAAAALDPQNMELRFAQGIVTGMQGDADGARAIYREVLGKSPQATNAWLALGRSYSSAGDFAQAEAVVDEALLAVPGDANLKWAKAGYLERRGEIGAAIDIYEGLYDAQSSSLIAANNLASLLSSYRETPATIERAYAIARRLKDVPQPPFQDTYGWIAFLRGDLEDALAHLEPAAAGLPGDPLVQYHLARAYQALERPKDAAQYYRKAIAALGDGSNDAMKDVTDRLAAVSAAEGAKN